MDFDGTERFHVRRQLGAGGMGVVYEAFDHERGQPVALKTLRGFDEESGDLLLRFKSEFRTLQDVRHRNLVQLGELIADRGRWFFTMELVDGVDFISWVGEGVGSASFDEVRLRAALIQLADGLGALHAAGIVHRDIKPANIMVEADGRVVLLDLGLATQRRDPLLSDAQVVGTPDYMAPEQAASRPAGPPADWYSVGVLVHQALTGKVPFEGLPLQVLIDKQRTTPPPVSSLRPGVPPDLEAICAQLLVPDPERRLTGAQLLMRLGAPARTGGAALRTPSGDGTPPPFVGRHDELAMLERARIDARQGAVTVLIEGVSGLGKSQLAERFLGAVTAAGTGTIVLRGRCHEREAVPYKAVDGVIDGLSRLLGRMPAADVSALVPVGAAHLRRVFPVLRRVDALARVPEPAHILADPQELRGRVFTALRLLLERLAQKTPVILLLDDLHWADGDSLALLDALLRGPGAPALLVVATSWPRVDGGRDVADALGGAVRRVTLAPLSVTDATALARLLARRGGLDPTSLPDTLTDEAGGHPLFIDELVRNLATGGRRAARARLEDVLWNRAQELGDDERRVLELIAVAGAPLAQDVVARAAGMDLGVLGRAASALRAGNLVRRSGVRHDDVIEPYHDRVRAAVLEHLDTEQRRSCHERLALALEAERDPDGEALAAHWQGAGSPTRAGAWAIQAAEHAEDSVAFDRAVRLYRLALALAPDDRALQRDLLPRLGDALANGGRGGEAAVIYRDAAALALPLDALDLDRRAATQLLASGDVDQGIVVLRSVLQRVGLDLPATPRRALISLALGRARIRLRGLRFTPHDAREVAPAVLNRIDVCWTVSQGLAFIDIIRGGDFQTRHLRHALAAGEPTRVVRALAVEAGYQATVGTGGTARPEVIMRRAEEVAATVPSPYLDALVKMSRGVVLSLQGSWRASRALFDEAEEVLVERCTGVSWELDTSRFLWLLDTYYLGELLVLRRRLPALFDDAQRRGNLFAETTLRIRHQGVVELADDQADAALARLDELSKRWSQVGFHLQHWWVLIVRTDNRLYAGDAAGALAGLQQQWDPLGGSMLLRVQQIRIEAWALRGRAMLAAAACAGAAERPGLLRQARACTAKLRRERAAWADAFAALIEAGIAACSGDDTAARAAARAAQAGFAASDMALHARVARWRAGDETPAWFAEQGIRNPARFVAMMAPGWPG